MASEIRLTAEERASIEKAVARDNADLIEVAVLRRLARRVLAAQPEPEDARPTMGELSRVADVYARGDEAAAWYMEPGDTIKCRAIHGILAAVERFMRVSVSFDAASILHDEIRNLMRMEASP